MGPHNEDYSILGSILGFFYFGKPAAVLEGSSGCQGLRFQGLGEKSLMLSVHG